MKLFIKNFWLKIKDKLLKIFITDEPFMVEFSSNIFCVLGKISLFWLIRNKLIPAAKDSHRFVECWVILQLPLSFVLALVCSAPNVRWWEWIAIGFGIAFLCETVIYQINVALFDSYRNVKTGKNDSVRSYRRIVILLLLNYLEIVFWFALFYRNMVQAFETGKTNLNSFPTAVHFSLVTMTGFGNTNIFPTEPLSYFVTSIIHMAIGLIMVVLILTTFISLIPKRKTQDKVELKEIEEFKKQN